MITSIPLLLFGPWINLPNTFFLFGLYYGFLITLPIGPSQLLSIRAFLLEGNIGGIVAISGLMVGQFFIFFSSIYYSPFYILLIKPHLFSLISLSYLFFYWYRIKDLLNYQFLRPIKSFQDNRIYNLFFDSIIFQLLNPVLLPSPVLARLANIFFFRYSHNILFLISIISGWLCGQFFFITSSKILLFRIESDSPILYLLLKRIIHRIFSITILSFCLLHLGRTPVPFFTKKIIDNLQFNFSKREKSLFSQKSWPNIFFDYRQWKRPLRYVENSRFSTRSPIKRRVSQYFFTSSLSDGNPRLSFTYLPSLAIFEKNFNDFELLSSNKILTEWIRIREEKREYIYNEFKYRVQFLDKGFPMTKVMEKKAGLSNFRERTFTKFYDPLLTRQNHEVTLISKSPWFLTDYKSKEMRKSQIFRERNNRLKFWVSNKWKELEYKNLALPWEPLTRDARRILSLLIDKSKKTKFETNLQKINFFRTDTKIESIEKSNLPLGNMRKKTTRKSNLNWELILNLSPRQKNLYFDYLQIDQWDRFKNSWKNLFLSYITRVKNISPKIDKKFLFREMNKEIPRWTPHSKNDKFDVIAIGVTDIRQRKVKNLGYLIKGRDKRRKIVRRFSQQSDFRRKLVKGSIRARRRKTLIWKIFQLKINSPFFLRIIEKPTFRPIYSKEPSITGIFGLDPTLLNIPKKKELFFKKKVSFFEKTKTDRLAIANRWDFPLAQWGRSWLLIIQSHVRKYFALPLLIILKNVSRFLLFQNTEWNQDWSEWNKEIHIRCTYDGTEVSEKELPEQWLRDGLQIKIIYPFHLKPWHNLAFRNIDLEKNNEYFDRSIKKRRFYYCYLTAWGFLTDLPFGNMKKQPSFWKPISKELKSRWRKNILFGFFERVKKKSFIISDLIISRMLNIEIKKSPKINPYGLSSDQEYSEITTNTHGLLTKSNDIVLEIPKKSESETLIYMQNLENLVLEKNKNKTQVYFNNSNKGKDYCFDKKRKKIKLIEQSIRIKQIIIHFCRKKIKVVKKWFSILKINIQTIKMNFAIKVEIIKQSIKLFFNN
uniref:Protein TIC 214 n=1 Tax=Schistochila macrodonta TaxID=2575589 RepID=A0A4Y5P5I5_9MARC|nr:Ycf1 [Schistochila macrodonta]QCW58560.1 Ycf1 [Schistochila macrodonta]